MQIAIKASINERFISAEYGGSQAPPSIALTANRDEVKGYETFEEVKLTGGAFALQTHDGHYLTADINGDLRTNATEINVWENFEWAGTKIKTFHDTYLTARIDKEFVPVEQTLNDGIWEDFTRVPLESDVPIGRPDLDGFHKIGASIANCFLANHYDYQRFANILGENKLDLTGVNLTSAHWDDMAGVKGTYPWQLPNNPGSDPFDLYKFNEEYLEKLYNVINAMHSNGVHVILTLLELYSWSNRKKSSGVPDANKWHWRNNVNGVKWGGAYNGDRTQDDETLVNCPDAALKALIDFLAPIWKINGGISVKIGNEYPEKDLHYRCRDYIRRHNPNLRFIVNRNEDTPGQYQNMKIGSQFHMLDHHGWEDLSFLDKVFSDEPQDRPETFKQFFDKKASGGGSINVDHARVIVNSDGARNGDEMPPNTYVWDDLYEVHKFCWEKGCSIDHQSQVKMTGDMDDFEVDYMKRLTDLR